MKQIILASIFTLFHLVSCWNYEKNENYIYPTLYHYNQKLDHFNPTVDKTFQQRYFVSDQYWNKGKGPIFFYTGNEGDVTAFINNTGFVWDIAPIFQAMVVFAEHRYYGESKPYGDIEPTTNTTAKFAQLTAEQALADFAELITFMKSSIAGAENSAVIAFGGSYGGMLCSWMRIKYGHIVDGAIAASAPVKYFHGLTDCDGFNRVVKDDFESTLHGPQCVKNIRNAWPLINQTAQKPGGLKTLSQIFHTCKPLESGDELINWIVSCWGNMAMVDYPYPANFIQPLPAWPVNATCDQLATPMEGTDLLNGMFNAINIYANHTGNVKCFDTSNSISGGVDSTLWNYQFCTEMVMPFCADGIHDMFPASPWSYDGFAQGCQETYGVTPRKDWIVLNFGGGDLKSSSNIVFSNGLLDPWHAGGILEDVSDTVVAIKIWGAAHHLDLRHHEDLDPPSVVQAREQEMIHITKWIAEAWKKPK